MGKPSGSFLTLLLASAALVGLAGCPAERRCVPRVAPEAGVAEGIDGGGGGGAGGGGVAVPAPPAGNFDKINQFVVIVLENRSFDHLFGELPGVEGLAASRAAAMARPQVNGQDVPYPSLPPPVNVSFIPPIIDPRFPPNLPNAPFAIDDFVKPDQPLSDLVHRFFHEKLQINGGRMDKFALYSDARGLTMGFFRTEGSPLARLGRDYTVCDQFFHSAFGGSFLNHQYLIAARAPVFEAAPEAMLADVDKATGRPLSDGVVTADGCFVVNTAYAAGGPSPAGYPRRALVPPQNAPTIGDRLTAKNVTWAWFAGGWKAAVGGMPDPRFQYHHQPFAYYAAYGADTPGRAEHLKDEADFLEAARTGTLPAVSFVKPLGPMSGHPGYSTVVAGESHAVSLVEAVVAGPQWKDTAIIVTYDENGGFWDHVAPPAGDEFGPGTRVPTVVVSPWARRGHVDSTVYETVSILATIEHRFGLEPLAGRDAAARDLAGAFDFTRPVM